MEPLTPIGSNAFNSINVITNAPSVDTSRTTKVGNLDEHVQVVVVEVESMVSIQDFYQENFDFIAKTVKTIQGNGLVVSINKMEEDNLNPIMNSSFN